MPQRTTTADDYRRRLQRAQALLEARLDEEVSPVEAARAAHFSLHHFHRIFRAQLGESVMEYTRRLRLERAARELRLTEQRLLEVALRAGYQSHEAFTRAFTERFGVTPSAFRERPTRVAAWVLAPEAPRLEVHVRRFPALRLVGMRHRGSYADVGDTWARLMRWGFAHAPGAAQYGLCPDDPDVTATENLRFDACLATDVVHADVTSLEVDAGAWAVAVHRGPYSRLSETYLDLIGRWFPTSGHEPAVDAVVEHYLDDPRVTPDAELRTEVRVRLAEV
jgi:AraC family transcriptional regulator